MKIFLSFVISFLFLTTQAQFTNKGNVKIMSGTTLYITGFDVVNDNGTSHTWSNDGTVVFKGDNFTNDGTMDDSANGTTEFSGPNEQHIQGTSVSYFHNLNIDNTNNSVIQESFVDTDNMTLSDGAKDFDYKVATDKSLTVNDVLTTNGDIRLTGTSQLVQTHTGTTSNGGSKYIWIDQQGTTNQYRYNYWSSPVNQRGTWKMGYLKDGAQGDNDTKGSYLTINTTSSTAATGDLPSQSHPVTLNEYWVWTYNGLDNNNSAWIHLQSTTSVNPGEGYTMKGPGVDANLNAANDGATTIYNSWTFAGVPNDGDYSLTINQGDDRLIGNPYPSALDADEFIKDNLSSSNGGNNTSDIFNGTLYFWDHTGGSDHYAAHYVGGYDTYTLLGGAPAPNITGAKTPQKYIPVGQGFMVWADANSTGGNIVFKNSQRIFKTEGSTSVFIRPATNLTDIRIGLTTPTNYHRQLLLGVRDNTTNGVDIGWDGPNFDSDFPGVEMSWLIDNRKFVIQAVPQITKFSAFPLKVESTTEGVVTFTLDEISNLPSGINNLYIYDRNDNGYHLISETDEYEVYLDPGIYEERFKLVFNKRMPNSAEELILENVSAYFNANTNEIVIRNNKKQLINSANLFALTGQQILSEKLDTDNTEIRIPVQIATGIYLLNVISGDKVYTTKLSIK